MSPMRCARRRGVAALELIVAVAVLGIGVTSLLALTVDVAASARRAFAAEARWRQRERVLEALVRASRQELQAMVGRRTVAGERVAVSELGAGLFRIEIVGLDGTALLRTVVLSPPGVPDAN